MTSVLHIRLFGNFHITLDDEPLPGFESVRVQSLLAYLLVNREDAQARQHLAYLLWPNSTEAQARTNLRRELHHLRRALPEADRFLQVDAKTLQWQTSAPFTLDVAEFDAVVNQLEQAETRGDDLVLIERLEEAVRLFAGDLLSSCYDDWIMPVRERFSTVYIRLLEELVQLLERRHDTVDAIRYTQLLLRYDPLYETSYRQLMRLYALHGDRARALRVYHTCVTTLRRELDVEPSPATRASYQRLLDADAVSEPVPVPLTRPETSRRLVGRQQEWETMQAAWRTAANIQPHCVIVTGVAGIGKTRLLEEMSDSAARQGIVTASTRCYAAEGRLAYAPVAEWLRSDAFRTHLMGLEPVWLTEVARLLPELLVTRPELARPQPVTDSGQKLRLFRALAQVVLAGNQPLLLVVDDLLWCDRETLEWLHYLLRYDPNARLLIAGAVRVEEMAVDHPLSTLLQELRNTEQLTEIALGPLPADATATLAEQIVGHDIDPDLARALHDEAEGNALFTVEMVRARLAQADNSQPRGLVDSSGQSGGQNLILPPKVYAVIQYRLAQLSAQARDLVELAAIIGRDFTYEVLAQASGQDEDTLVRGLDELWQRQIIREQGADAYDFSHDKIREVAFSEILSARQKMYHRRVAQALEIVHKPALDTVTGQIAFHFEQAGLLQEAIGYYRRAAEVAQRIYANDEAIVLYTRAVEVSRQITPVADAVELLPVYEGRGLVWNSLAHYDRAIADLQIMCQMARDAGKRQKVGESLCHLAYAHWLMFSEKEVPFAQQYAQEAIELARQSGDQKILARSLTMLGAVDQVHRNLGKAGEKFEEALAISRRAGHTDALVQTLAFLSLQTYLQGDFQSTVQYAQEGVDGSRLIQDGLSELRILAFLCQATWSLGHYSQALAMVKEGMAHAKERGNTFIVGRLLNTLGWFHTELGDLSKAIEYDQESVELGRTAGIANVELSASINLGYEYLALGQYARALAWLEPTLERVEGEAFGAHKWRWEMKLSIVLAEHAYGTGAYEQALRYVDNGLAQAMATTSQKYVAKGRGLRGKILTQLGDTATAGAELRQAFSLAEQLQSPSLLYPLAHALGQWYESEANEQEAAEHFGIARATIDQMAASLADEALRSLFLQSNSVRAISDKFANRT